MYFQQILQTTYIVAMMSRRVGNIQASLKYLTMNQALAIDLEHGTEVRSNHFIITCNMCNRTFNLSQFLDNII